LKVNNFKLETLKKTPTSKNFKSVKINTNREKQISSIIKIENLDDELISDIKGIPSKIVIDKTLVIEKMWYNISE
jgi:hypothetical protein